MEDSYINPFGPEVGKDKFSSFSSRVTLGNEATDFLLSSVGFGKQRIMSLWKRYWIVPRPPLMISLNK